MATTTNEVSNSGDDVHKNFAYQRSTYLAVLCAVLCCIYTMCFSRHEIFRDLFITLMESAFYDEEICIRFYDDKNILILSIDENSSNSLPFNSSSCLDVSAVNTEGMSSMLSISEPRWIDAYINGDIKIDWSEDLIEYERQMTIIQRMGSAGSNRFPFKFHYFSIEFIEHFYHHWIEQFVSSTFAISYAWKDVHYTDMDLIITSFLDQKWFMYTQGIGYSQFRNASSMPMDVTLNQSIENKLKYIINKCQLKRGSRALDVGGGWGPILRYAVPLGIDVHSITISRASFKHLKNVKKQLLIDNNSSYGSINVSFVNFWELKDYSNNAYDNLQHSFDAIILIGLIEALPHYSRLLKTAKFFLKPNGFLYFCGVGMKIRYDSSYLMQKYIFPGETAPFHASTFWHSWENSRYKLIDISVDTINYANTMYYWIQRFEQQRKNPNHLMNTTISAQNYRMFQLFLWGFWYSFQDPIEPNQAYRIVLQNTRS